MLSQSGSLGSGLVAFSEGVGEGREGDGDGRDLVRQLASFRIEVETCDILTNLNWLRTK